MCSPLKNHVLALNESFIQKLVATLRRFARLASASQEDPSFFIFNGHEVSWNLDVHDVGAVAVRLKVVHKQVVGVVHKEVQGVHHFSVISNQRHLDGLLNNFDYSLLGFGLFLQQFHLHLFIRLLHQEVGLPN